MSPDSGFDNDGRIIFERWNVRLNVFISKIASLIIKKDLKMNIIPYSLFVLILAFGIKIIAIALDHGNFKEYMEQLIKEYMILFYVSIFLVLLFSRSFKKKILIVFMDEDKKYPKSFINKRKEMINYIFFNYKIKTDLPFIFKFFKILYFISIFIAAPIMGVIIAIASIQEGRWGLADPIISGFFGVVFSWFVTFTVSFHFIGIMLMLSELMRAIEKDRDNFKKITPTTLKRYRDLQGTSLSIFLGYNIFMMAVPKYFIDAFGNVESWAILSVIAIIAFTGGFLIVLIVPNYLIFRIISLMKGRLKNELIKDLEKIEKDISKDNIEIDTIEKYNAKEKMINTLDDIKGWPSDFMSLSQILFSILIGNTYNLIKILNELILYFKKLI